MRDLGTGLQNLKVWPLENLSVSAHMVINTLLMSVIVYNCLVEGLREHPNTLMI